MTKKICLYLVTVGCLMLASCSTRVKMSINPDRSGKMEVAFQCKSLPILANQFMKGDTPYDADKISEAMAMMLKVFLANTEGVEEVCDGDFTDDGETSHLKVTAYFRDYNKLRFQETYAGLPAGESNINQSSTIDEHGNWILVLNSKRLGMDKHGEVAPIVKVDEDAVHLRVLELQNQANSAMRFLTPFIAFMGSDSGQRSEVKVGGEILEAKGYKVNGKNSAWMSENLTDSLKFVLEMLMDEEFLHGVIMAAKEQGTSLANFDPAKFQPSFRKYVIALAKHHNPDFETMESLVIRPGAPLFDYNAEVAAAKQRPGKLITLMRHGPPTEAPRQSPPPN